MLSLIRPVELYHLSWSVLDGFSQVVGFNYISVFQVGDSASQFEDTVESPGRKIELLHGCLEQALGLLFCLTRLPDLGWCHFSIGG